MSTSINGSALVATLRERLRANFWFIPSLMGIASVAGALFLLRMDRMALELPITEGWLYSGGVEGARGLLTSVSGATLTLAGVVFSINIVALVMASQQFGPRLLGNFVRDLGSQVTLGTFTSIFLFCLLVLREVQGSDGPDGKAGIFVPHLSITAAITLAAVGLAVLIYYVHHIAVSIQAPVVIANVGLELEKTIKREFPYRLEASEERSHYHDGSTATEHLALFQVTDAVNAPSSGYLQAVDFDRLVVLATRYDLVLKLENRPREFLTEGVPVLSVYPPGRMSNPLARELRNCFYVGRRRTATQDIEFAIHEIVELGVRALSPALNDPNTAVTCIEWLGTALEELFQRDTPRGYMCDDEDQLRLIWHPVTHEGVAKAALNQLRQYGRGSAPVLIRLLEMLNQVAAYCRNANERRIITQHSEMIIRAARESLPEAGDVAVAEDRYQILSATLAAGRPV